MSERERLFCQFDLLDDQNFEDFALSLYRYQSKHNIPYKKYHEALNIDSYAVEQIEKIPFLPIQFFKTQRVISGPFSAEKAQAIFESSGTGQGLSSKHYVFELSRYLMNSLKIFEQFYGDIRNYSILALLPSYLERSGSSLIAMIDYFIQKSENTDSGYYLYDHKALVEKVAELKSKGDRRVIVWGVSFALLELAERRKVDFSDCIVMETGGMKGRRKELTREELHEFFREALNIDQVHSEYGMTELLSQAYSKGKGVFVPSNSMKILVREVNDPFHVQRHSSKTGGLNIVDLANIDSCAFIETQDLGMVNPDGTFRVYGRFDHSDLRGCNLLVY